MGYWIIFSEWNGRQDLKQTDAREGQAHKIRYPSIMKTKSFYVILTLAGMVAAPNLFAGMSVTLLDNGYLNNNPANAYSQGNGGEFRAVGDAGLDSIVNWNAYATTTSGKISSTVDNPSWGYNSGLDNDSYFQTFCVEFNEEFTPGTPYSVSVSPNAMYGGQKPPTTGDPISIGTAWLYRQFAAGTLFGVDTSGNKVFYDYSYGSGRQNSAGALQQAIWYLEGESNGSSDGVSGDFIREAKSVLGGDITRDANGAYGVYALNLGSPGQVQDQLVIAVPEPATILGALALLIPLGAGTIRILRNQKGNCYSAGRP
jgi:hypothetical protein